MAKAASPVRDIVRNGKPVVTLANLIILEGEAFDTALNDYLADLAQRGSAMFQEIHTLACCAIQRAMDTDKNNEVTNNFEPMTKVVQAVALMKGARHSTLIGWFETHTPARWSKTKSGDRFKLAGDNAYDLESAQATPYYEKPEVTGTKEFTLRDLLKMIEGATKKAEGKGASSAQASKLKEISAKLNADIVPMLEKAIADEAVIEAPADDSTTEETTGTEVSLTSGSEQALSA